MQTIIRICQSGLSFNAGEHIAIVGDNAAGKTNLVNTILDRNRVNAQRVEYDFSPSNKHFISENIQYVTFQDVYGDSVGNYYLQLRWNQMEIDRETPTVGALLERSALAGKADDELRERLYGFFGLKPLLDKYIISLSSGELRKFQLAKALLSSPRVLILDNPFIGLDSSSRDLLSGLLQTLAERNDIMIILVMSRYDFIPGFITHIVPVKDLEVLPKLERKDFDLHPFEEPLSSQRLSLLDSLPEKDLSDCPFYPKESGGEIIKMKDLRIKYGERTILNGIDWTVTEGQKWVITGENGSGKSTLLSLICADNPQSYACNIELFGHRRGSGESIWDIKKHIGYVSPELFRSYQKNISALDVVASGLFDTVGLYMHPSEEQYRTSLVWMKIFDIDNLAERPFLKLSSGEQRLCLLTRAFVKDPELLILDEPLHGIDLRRCGQIKMIIDKFASRKHKTLLMVSHYSSEIPSCVSHRFSLSKTV